MPRKRQSRASSRREITANSGRISDKSLANLKPFPKGVSGNPDGRPRGTREFAELIAGETHGGEELVEFALKVFRGEKKFRSEDKWSAMRWAADYLTERMLGRTPQTIELTGKDGGPILEYSGARERLIERLSAILAVRIEGPAQGPAALQLEAGAPKPS